MDCPRCGGLILTRYLEQSCITCGWAGETRTPDADFGRTGQLLAGGHRQNKPILPGER